MPKLPVKFISTILAMPGFRGGISTNTSGKEPGRILMPDRAFVYFADCDTAQMTSEPGFKPGAVAVSVILPDGAFALMKATHWP